MAVRAELGRLAQEAAAEPGTVPLPLVCDDLNLQTAAPGAAAAHLAGSDSCVHQLLDVALQPPAKVLVQRAAAGQDDVLVKATANVDRRLLNHGVDDVGEGREEIRAVDFGVEEDLGGQESLVANVDGSLASAGLGYDVLGELSPVPIVFGKLFDDIWADIAVLLLDLLSRFQG